MTDPMTDPAAGALACAAGGDPARECSPAVPSGATRLRAAAVAQRGGNPGTALAIALHGAHCRVDSGTRAADVAAKRDAAGAAATTMTFGR